MIRPALVAASLAFAPVAFSGVAQAQEDRFANVAITSETAGPGVEVLYGAGGNIALAHGAGEALLVDDQFAPLTPKIIAKVKELAGTEPRFLVNTHWHGDHTGGNENFGKSGTLIIAQDNVRQRMSSERASGNDVSMSSTDVALPILTFRDRQTIHSAGMTIRAVHVQHAHTDGDALVHFVEPNVLHMGDTFFEGSSGTFPYIDANSGGSIQGAINAVDTGLKLANAETAIIPGHGKLTNREGLSAYRAMLIDLRDRVQSLIDAGSARDAVIAAQPAAPYSEGRADGFVKPDAFVGVVYDGLKAAKSHHHEGGETHAH